MQTVYICGIDTTKIPKLSKKEQDELLEKIRYGDKVARDYFLYANIRLVLSVMKRFSPKGVDIDDVFQVGCLGMVKALNNFNYDFNVRFSTYAVPMIIGEIKRYLRDSSSVKVSRSLRDIAYKVIKKREELEFSGVEANIVEVAKEIDIPLKDVAMALNAVSDVISYYEPVYSENEDEILMLDQLADKKHTDIKWTEYIALFTALERLCDKEKQIIDLRYFKGFTQKEIASMLDISQAQVSRLEKIAINKMKKYLE